MAETYLPDETHAALVEVLTALDHDPAHPHPLSDRITIVLGEVGNIWPACIQPDNMDQIAETPGDKKAAKRLHDTLEMNAKAMAKLERI